jgi:hypothetical protein
MENNINTDINIVGSIPNYDIILEIIEMRAKGDSNEEIKDKMINQNIFEIRTKYSRIRFLTVIKSSFLKFTTSNHERFILKMSENAENNHIKNLILYFQFAINNRLFNLITLNVFRKKLFDGAITFSKKEVEEYIYQLADKHEFIKELPVNTIKTVSYKYLTIMTKFGYLEGHKKKNFKIQIPDIKDLLFSIYFLHSIGIPSDKIFSHELMDLWLIEDSMKDEIIKNAAIRNLIEYSSSGKIVDLKCNLSMEDAVNAITK